MRADGFCAAEQRRYSTGQWQSTFMSPRPPRLSVEKAAMRARAAKQFSEKSARRQRAPEWLNDSGLGHCAQDLEHADLSKEGRQDCAPTAHTESVGASLLLLPRPLSI